MSSRIHVSVAAALLLIDVMLTKKRNKEKWMRDMPVNQIGCDAVHLYAVTKHVRIMSRFLMLQWPILPEQQQRKTFRNARIRIVIRECSNTYRNNVSTQAIQNQAGHVDMLERTRAF